MNMYSDAATKNKPKCRKENTNAKKCCNNSNKVESYVITRKTNAKTGGGKRWWNQNNSKTSAKEKNAEVHATKRKFARPLGGTAGPLKKKWFLRKEKGKLIE